LISTSGIVGSSMVLLTRLRMLVAWPVAWDIGGSPFFLSGPAASALEA
jgi:hypothetical protein